MVSINLSTVVWLESNSGNIDGNGHLVVPPSPSGWSAGFAFPGDLFADDTEYVVTVEYLNGPADAEVDMYSLISATPSGYSSSNMTTLAYAYINGSGQLGGTRNASLTGAGTGRFIAYFAPGVGSYSAAMTNGERNVLWYAPGLTITSITLEPTTLLRGPWGEQGADFTRTFGTFELSTQPWPMRGFHLLEKDSAPGADPVPLSKAEVVATEQAASDDFPPSLTAGYSTATAMWVTWSLTLNGSIGEPDAYWTTTALAQHGFGFRRLQVVASVDPGVWPEGAIGYEWDDPTQPAGAAAYAEPLEARLLPTSTITHDNWDASAVDETGLRYDPGFTTHIMVGPAVLTWGGAEGPPSATYEVGTYTYPGTGWLGESEGEKYPTTHTLAEYSSIPSGGVDVLPMLRDAGNHLREGLVFTQTDAVEPVGEINASLFGGEEMRVGAILGNTTVIGLFRPPRVRWIYGTSIPPGQGRLKVAVEGEWKFANPKPGENGGFGRLKVAGESSWLSAAPLMIPTSEGWKPA